jgi:hypothetical protein
LWQSQYMAQAGLRLAILLPQLPEYWDYRCVPPCSTLVILSLLVTFILSLGPCSKCTAFLGPPQCALPS